MSKPKKVNKDTKIEIPEINKNMVYVSRAGSEFRFRHEDIVTNKFDLDTDLIIKSPVKGLGVFESTDNRWFWVCDCPECLGKDKSFAYSVCYSHDICVDCGMNRTKIKGCAWGVPGGFRCDTCEKNRIKKEIEDYSKKKLSPEQYDDYIICPFCGNKDDGIETNESDDEYSCGNCNSVFEVEVEYSKTFSMSFIKEKP